MMISPQVRALYRQREEAWRRAAACRGADPSIFFPERGDNGLLAKEYCARCPVTAECLEYALVTAPRNGVWGGLTDRELRRLRRQRLKLWSVE